MSKDINLEIGRKIKAYRKLKKITLNDLSKKIYKSVSTISKYENGDILIDVETLYAIADALDVSVDKLLYIKDEYIIDENDKEIPKFFKDITKFYAYIYDGRDGKVIKSKFIIQAKLENNKYATTMFMNFKSLEEYQVCENTYKGYIEHFDAKSNIMLRNEETPMEQASVQILASYLDSDTKWSLWTGFSSRPMMPIATKMLISKDPIKIDKDFENHLKISKQDIKYLKFYNMLSVL